MSSGLANVGAPVQRHTRRHHNIFPTTTSSYHNYRAPLKRVTVTHSRNLYPLLFLSTTDSAELAEQGSLIRRPVLETGLQATSGISSKSGERCDRGCAFHTSPGIKNHSIAECSVRRIRPLPVPAVKNCSNAEGGKKWIDQLESYERSKEERGGWNLRSGRKILNWRISNVMFDKGEEERGALNTERIKEGRGGGEELEHYERKKEEVLKSWNIVGGGRKRWLVLPDYCERRKRWFLVKELEYCGWRKEEVSWNIVGGGRKRWLVLPDYCERRKRWFLVKELEHYERRKEEVVGEVPQDRDLEVH
ncbi:hypothetical protein J6590_033680 [Homalodisca vitripennis]|nr:hypothetical protein J6590_033680 [Homalodisca vitripennis]